MCLAEDKFDIDYVAVFELIPIFNYVLVSSHHRSTVPVVRKYLALSASAINPTQQNVEKSRIDRLHKPGTAK